MNATQIPLFEPVRPYGQVPHAGTDTSRAAAEDMEPNLGKWQQRVLLTLLEAPATDEAIEERLGCIRTRTSRPRRRELELAGFVRDSGERAIGHAGKPQIIWALTPVGIAKALKVQP